jgi:hypothetical protein
MSPRNTLLVSLTTAACALLASGVALAGNGTTAPGPGILGLVAIGVVGAIAIARWRK